MPSFLETQLAGIREEGLRALLRKTANLLLFVPTLPLLLLVRLLRPVVTIRFGRLRSGRIGHFAWNTEYYVCRREIEGAAGVDVFCCDKEIANRQLLKMWSRVLRTSRLIWPLWRLNHLIPGGRANEVDLPFGIPHYTRARDLLARTENHLRFSADEEESGRRALRKMGVPEGSPFICMYARDSAYLDALDRSRDWKYHDFRDTRISSFLPAAEEMTRRGYHVLRMGAVVGEPLASANPKIIDYAVKHRTDFLDIYVTAKCAWFLASNGGLVDVADVFRRPIVRTNMCQFFGEILLCGAKDIFIPKKLRDKKTGRVMSWSEIAKSPVWDANTSEVFEREGVELVANTSDEILAAAVELEERFKGDWRAEPGDEELQARFWKILADAGRYTSKPVTRIGAAYLRENSQLLV